MSESKTTSGYNVTEPGDEFTATNGQNYRLPPD